MAAYDASSFTISSMTAAPNDLLRLSGPDNSRPMLVGRNMDPFDPSMTFEADGLFNRDDVNSSGIPPLPYTPSFELSDAFSTTFEDPFPYQSTTDFSSLLDDTSSHPHSNEPSSNTADLDNKLLGFGAPILKAPVLDDSGQAWPAMSAELYGMFFVAEDVFGDNNTNANRPLELTCYRRNLFQISGTINLSRSLKAMINEQGQQVPIYDLTATLSALESIEGKGTEIISVPWKTSSGSSEDKNGAAPPKWPLDLSMNPELDPSMVSIPVAWKRLQFKHATANNGRRKGLQQHYVIQINLIATLATGETVKLAEIQSGPIIVRGRSPRNFDSRKDVSLSERRLDSKPRTTSDASGSAPQVKVDPGVANSSYRFYAPNASQQPLDLPDWNTNTSMSTPSSSELHPRQVKRPVVSNQASSISQANRPPVPRARWKSESVSMKSSQASAPIDLSLADDEYGKAHPAGHSRLGEPTSPALDRDKIGKKGIGSPVENADLLYEYFPLSLDDWMPPVDAIYRPHVVHHTVVPPDLKAAEVKNKSKRYFSADD